MAAAGGSGAQVHDGDDGDDMPVDDWHGDEAGAPVVVEDVHRPWLTWGREVQLSCVAAVRRVLGRGPFGV